MVREIRTNVLVPVDTFTHVLYHDVSENINYIILRHFFTIYIAASASQEKMAFYINQ